MAANRLFDVAKPLFEQPQDLIHNRGVQMIRVQQHDVRNLMTEHLSMKRAVIIDLGSCVRQVFRTELTERSGVFAREHTVVCANELIVGIVYRANGDLITRRARKSLTASIFSFVSPVWLKGKRR